jgi:hypothetical protein
MLRADLWIQDLPRGPQVVRRAHIAIGLCFLLVGTGSVGFSDEPKDGKSSAPPIDSPARRLFATHCVTCHAADPEKTAEMAETRRRGSNALVLDRLPDDFSSPVHAGRWNLIAEHLRAGTMPPPGETRPERDEVAAALDWIGSQMALARRASSDGRTVMRRLNQAEYVNSIRDLLEVDVDLSDLFPAETSVNGFDNNAESLHLSSFQMENYLRAAERALDAAIVSGPRPPTAKRRFDIKDEKTVKPKGSVYRHTDDGVAIFSSWVSANIQVTLWQYQTRARGRYRFRISAYGMQTMKPIVFHVMEGPLNAAAQQTLVDYFDVPPAEPRVVEFVRSFDPARTIRIIADGLGATPPEVERVGADKYTGPGLVVQWVEVEGPLLEDWPPKSHRRLFGDLPRQRVANARNADGLEVVSEQPADDLAKIIREFARRAFRRPVGDSEIAPFLTRAREKFDQGATFEQAVRIGLRGILVSPGFLFLRERPGQLDDYALASRLSYFLWSSPPDELLLRVAERGDLRRAAVLREQVERMLKDPKSNEFTRHFTGQWLGLRAIDATMPDRMLYPEFDEVLQISSVKEARLFFDELLRNDQSIANFVSSDFTFVNDRLARHYGLPPVEGIEMRKVSLPDDGRRGGVLTMASVLKVTANGTTTSPILRGAWVLERILGTPPPKPTVDVAAVDPDIRGATTIREQLEKHRSHADCAGCHALIDPPGFALENYDVIGGWRERYRSIGKGDPIVVDGQKRRYLAGPVVESADKLLDGRPFADIGQFKQLLLQDKDQLARSLAEKLLAYATGANPTLADRHDIEKIVERVRAKEYGLRSLVHEVVQSETFGSK